MAKQPNITTFAPGAMRCNAKPSKLESQKLRVEHRDKKSQSTLCGIDGGFWGFLGVLKTREVGIECNVARAGSRDLLHSNSPIQPLFPWKTEQ